MAVEAAAAACACKFLALLLTWQDSQRTHVNVT